MTDSEKLNKLAEWLDLKNPGEGNEVQQDLRRIASELSALRTELSAANKEIVRLNHWQIEKQEEVNTERVMVAAAEIESEYQDKIDQLTAELHKAKEENEELKTEIIAERILTWEVHSLRKRCEDLEAVLSYFVEKFKKDYPGSTIALMAERGAKLLSDEREG